MKFNLEHLRVFYEVANAGSITAAAKKLNISQSALSRTITLLEEQLGVKLFERHLKGLKLLPNGERFYKFAHKTLLEAQVLVKLMRDDGDEVQGEIKVVTTPAVAMLLMSYIPDFMALYPKVTFKIIGHLDRVDTSDADVAIRPIIPHQPELIQVHMKSYPMKLYASPDYLEKSGIPQEPEDLDHHHIVAFGDDRINIYSNSNWALQLGTKPGVVRTPCLEVSSAEGLLYAAEMGFGIAEISEDYKNLKNANLIEVLPHIKGPDVDLYYIYPEALKDSKRIITFQEYLINKLSPKNAPQKHK